MHMKFRLLAVVAAASLAAFGTDMDHKGRVIATVETRGSGIAAEDGFCSLMGRIVYTILPCLAKRRRKCAILGAWIPRRP